ncbi:MAG TPA: holo-ACP synthase [Acidobacteriota bacterium]|jgi:holo-[acyl-carrier protein] synthase|nr:holo-ACP synthase [Acidobacteriota bacterium]HNT17331.1 holo-ACP synthase [Acidobacteriota bacterium]
MLIGLGSDIVSVIRIAGVASRRHGFAGRILARTEMEIYEERKRSPEFLAGRFAAKEAFLKALGTGLGNGILFPEIEIRPGASGNPLIDFRGRAMDVFRSIGGKKAFVSISHEKDYALAVAVIEG